MAFLFTMNINKLNYYKKAFLFGIKYYLWFIIKTIGIMRGLEYLIQLFPDKTGKELLEIQNQDKIEDEKRFQKEHEGKLKIINDINENGGYYRGTFGMNQYFYYSFSNMRLENGKIYCDVKHLVCFDREKSNESTTMELRQETWRDFETYGIEMYERTKKEDFNKVCEYYSAAFKLFWKYIDAKLFERTN